MRDPHTAELIQQAVTAVDAQTKAKMTGRMDVARYEEGVYDGLAQAVAVLEGVSRDEAVSLIMDAEAAADEDAPE